MESIKEIALRIAPESGAVAYSPPPLRAVRGYSFTYDELADFAEALIAELQKQNEPVAYLTRNEDGDPAMLFFHLAEACNYSGDDYPEPLYLAPPNTEQIEQRVAEACVALCNQQAERDAEHQKQGISVTTISVGMETARAIAQIVLIESNGASS